MKYDIYDQAADWIGVVAFLAIVVLVSYLLISGYSDCANRGGVYVRSVFWYACIPEK